MTTLDEKGAVDEVIAAVRRLGPAEQMEVARILDQDERERRLALLERARTHFAANPAWTEGWQEELRSMRDEWDED